MTRPTVRRLFALLASLSLLATMALPVAAVDGDKYVSLANQKRASVGKAPVSLVSAVDQITIERANHMAAHDDFTHDLDYVVARLKQMGICYSGYGEIIAYERGYPTYDPARTIEQWWNSSGHKAIMLGDYNAAGGSHATSSRSGKIYSAMVFVKMCTPPSGSGGSGGSGGDVSISRLAGGDRYATAAAISRARFGAGASTVFVATGKDFPDALAGSPAAASARSPILLTDGRYLPGATATELDRLNPSRIVILGGTGTVSNAVASALTRYAGSVVRWAGGNRFETAARISANSFGRGVPVAYVATSRKFPDALSGGAVAGRAGGPILLVEPTSIPSATASELSRLAPARIVVLGGTTVISDGVKAALDRYTTGSVTRLAGGDRFATSVQISRSAYGSAGSDAAFVATGTTFPDGLAGGPVAALVPGPLLLVSPTQLPSSTRGELQRLNPDKVYVLGGTGVVSPAVVSAFDNALP